METWTAWQGTKALAFLHARVRQLLLAQGVEEHWYGSCAQPVHLYAAGPKDARRTVVLLHGLGDSANNWFRTMPLLAWRGDRVLALDLPGHGLSAPHDERGFLTIREHAALVKDLVARHAVGTEVAIVGHSLGGWVAARTHLAGLDAQRMVLVEAAGLEYEGMWDVLEVLRIEHEADVKRFFRTICHSMPFALNVLSHEVASMFKCPAVANFIAAPAHDDLIKDEELARVRAKTTIMWGEDDGLIPPILAHRWEAGIPDATLKWIPKCGHAPQFERPLVFQRLLEEALGHPPMTQEIKTRIRNRLPDPLRRRLAGA